MSLSFCGQNYIVFGYVDISGSSLIPLTQPWAGQSTKQLNLSASSVEPSINHTHPKRKHMTRHLLISNTNLFSVHPVDGWMDGRTDRCRYRQIDLYLDIHLSTYLFLLSFWKMPMLYVVMFAFFFFFQIIGGLGMIKQAIRKLLKLAH